MVLILFGLLKLNPKPFELRGQGLPAKTENLVILMPPVGQHFSEGTKLLTKVDLLRWSEEGTGIISPEIITPNKSAKRVPPKERK